MRTTFKLAAAAALAMGIGAGAAQAAPEVTFIGSTAGCFGAACAPGASATLGGLHFKDATFDVTTAGLFVAIGENAAVPNIDNLGSMQLTPTAFAYTGQTFTLEVTFTAPPGTAPGSTAFVANLQGTVDALGGGGVLINFNNNPIAFTFTGGTFELSVNDVSVTATNNIVPLTGSIIATLTPVPEPMTLALFGAGLLGLGAVQRARRERV